MTFDEFKIHCLANNISIDQDRIEKLKKYANILLETNKVMNLTAIKEIGDVVEKHFFDSILLFKLFDYKNSTLLDIGSGAGFPGIVIAIMEPSCKVTILDATSKKIKFIEQLSNELGLDNVSFINSRVEDLRKQRETFDFATARAFSSLNTLIEVGIPLIKVGGYLISMKSAKAAQEIEESKTALRKLESKIIKTDKCELPESCDVRVNIVIQKCQKTAKHFPRSWAEISTKPL